MIDGAQLYLVGATALACGLMSGAFYAFSSFVMAGLKRLPTADGVAAMQAINVTAVGPGFMVGLIGTALGSVAVAITAFSEWNETASVWLVLGAALYLGGVFGLTAVYHVPRNDTLAKIEFGDPEAEAVWSRYLREWTKWNHARAISGLAAAAALTIAIRLG